MRRIHAVRAILDTLLPPTAPNGSDGLVPRDGGEALIFVWALEQKSSRRGWDEGDEQDVMVPWVMKQEAGEARTFRRYYHLYRRGELENDIVEAGGVIVAGGYERDNWWAVARRRA